MKGGLRLVSVHDEEFKYTRSAQRIQWTKNVFPIGQYLIQIVRKIPWTSYIFEDAIDLFYPLGENNEAFDPSKPDEFVATKVPIRTKWTTIQKKVESPILEPYYFFGGCVYEILNTLIPDIPLREYVDPTGDIDVRLCLPYIETLESRDIDFIDYHLNADGTMNKLLHSYTVWLMEQVKIQFETLPKPLFDKLFENTIPFDFHEHQEAAYSDIQIPIGNLWIVRVPFNDKGMIKIQVICKFVNTEADHCLEFLLLIHPTPKFSQLNESILDLNNDRLMIRTFSLESFRRLLEGNLDSMKNRKFMFNDDNLRHKFYNHVGRMEYLNMFFSRETNHAFILSLPQNAIVQFASRVLYLLHYFISKRDAGEFSHFSHDGNVFTKAYTPNRMMDSLLSFLIRFVFPKLDTTKAPLMKSVRIDNVSYDVVVELSKFHIPEDGVGGAGKGGARKTRKTSRIHRRKNKRQSRNGRS